MVDSNKLQRRLLKLFSIPFLVSGCLVNHSWCDTVMVHPKDNGKALVNPGMGWSYGYDMNAPGKWFHWSRNADPVGYDSARSAQKGAVVMKWFPGCANVFVRLGWSYYYGYEVQHPPFDSTRILWKGVSPKPDFHRLEQRIDSWVPHGGKIGFAIPLYEPYVLDEPSAYSNTPPWVRQAGAQGRWVRAMWVLNGRLYTKDPGKETNRNDTLVDRNKPPGSNQTGLLETWPDNLDAEWSWVPNYTDATLIREFNNFLCSLKVFLEAKKAQYGGREILDFIDIGTIGNWGEGHQWPGREEDSIRSPSALLNHINMWRTHFPETRMFIPDEFGFNEAGQRANGYPAVLDSARAKGIGLGEHSVEIPEGNHSDTLAHYFNDSLPVSIENNNTKIPDTGFYHSVERMKASYARINAPAVWYLDSAKNIIDSVNLRLGYRFQITEASWTKNAGPGDNIAVSVKIRNAGVARCYMGGYAAIHILANEHRVLDSLVDTTYNVRELNPGPAGVFGPVREWTFNIAIPSTAKGNVILAVSIGDKQGNPVYALPHNTSGGTKRYRLGMLSETKHKSVWKHLFNW